MSLLEEWINPYYLRPEVRKAIHQDLMGKPYVKYTFLDDFFREDKLNQLIEHHRHFSFSEELDRRVVETGEWTPYDGEMYPLKPRDFSGELLFSLEWSHYLVELTGAELESPGYTEIKMRRHRPLADGFWIHSDSGNRKLVAICYFNHNWSLIDGGLLQVWHEEEPSSNVIKEIKSVKGNMDFLNHCRRLRTDIAGRTKPGLPIMYDYVLIDQILPRYNRLFLCNFSVAESFHSVTPSGNKERMGFVQWLF